VSAALLGSPTSGTRLSNSIGGELVYVAVPVFSGAQVRGVVRVTLPTSILDSRVREQLRNVLAAAFATILLAVLVAFVFARSVSKPIEKLRRATDRFASGDLSANAEAGGPKEIRKLAQSFNDMALRISGLVKRQKSFASDASHQLRTPLTALRLRLEQATTSIDSAPDMAKEHIEEAMNEADRLSHLVEQLLQLARSEGTVLEKSSCDVSEFMEERADEWDALATERGLVIQRSIAPGLHAETSQVALREIIDNYIDNAFESSATGGVIEFIAEKQSSHIELIIRDSGKGLTKEQRESAFERFWRGADAANRRSGSGLGLSIVSQLAQASGLAVELRESPKGGIDAVLVIPVAS
jgi:signal transduction histidine kinase